MKVTIDPKLKTKCPRTALGCVTALVEAGASPAALLEEMYVYFDMPDPAYGIQLVYSDTQNPEVVTVVRDGDAVLHGIDGDV